MKQLDTFILKIPHPVLWKIAYAWLGAVFFWNWAPVVSSLFMGIMLLGLSLMAWQKQAWETSIRREFHSGDAKPYIDHAHIARTFQIRNLLLVCMASGLLGWLLNGRFELSGLQWFLLLVGFMLLTRNFLLFGADVTYIITDQGIGILYVPRDTRLFFKFNEIWRAVRTKVPGRKPPHWDVLTPMRHPQDGLLLYAVRREGLSTQTRNQLLLRPTDMDEFLKELAGHVMVTEEAVANPE